MEFNEYQKLASSTAMYKQPIIYPALGLAGEAGEVAEKVKKLLRDADGVMSEDRRNAIKKELGDVLWYVSQVAKDIGVDLNSVAQDNIDKLFDRKSRGVITGSGDNR